MKRLADQNLYEILEVTPDATAEAIAVAVDRARALYGPGSIATYTLMSDEEAALLSRRIDEAQATLLDAGARARYDERLGRAPPPEPRPLPPVIPAVRVLPLPEPEGDEEAPDGPEPDDGIDEPARAAPFAPPAAHDAPRRTPPPRAAEPVRPAQRAPILLDREVSGPALTPVPVPAPTPPPVPTSVPLVPQPEGATPPPLPDATAWTGEVLRRLREARGITLAQLSERIKVTRHHIENIEGDRFGLLPAPVYLRGILFSIARELRLDGQKVARSYLERVSASAGASAGAGSGLAPKPR